MNNLSNQPLKCLLLPGLHGTNELYDPLIRELEKLSSKEDIVLDIRALNYPLNINQQYQTLTDWIQQEIDFDKIEVPLLVIAESFSTPIALLLAEAHPDKICAVILASGFCASPLNINFALLPLRPLFMIPPPRVALKHFLLDEDATKEELKKLREMIHAVPSKILSQRLHSVLTLKETNLPVIPNMPLLLLQAQHDALISWNIQNQLESHLPHAETHWIDSPHLLFQFKPQLAAKHIVEFISNLN